MTDNLIHPYLVTAPLMIDSAPSVDINTIFIFDYKNSFKDSNSKPFEMMKYLESFNGTFDLVIDKNTLYKEKEELLLRYFNSGVFFNCYSLTKTLIHILFQYKGIDKDVGDSIFNNLEALKFIDRNKMFLADIVKFYNSLFLIMFLYASKPTKDIKEIKAKYSKERILNDELSPNLCNVLFEPLFYDYYEKHVGTDIYYYSFMFDYGLYRSKDFLCVLTNKNNTLLPVLLDLNDKKFNDFLKENKL